MYVGVFLVHTPPRSPPRTTLVRVDSSVERSQSDALNERSINHAQYITLKIHKKIIKRKQCS